MKTTELPATDLCQVTRSDAAYLRRRKDLCVQNLQELWWMRHRFCAQIRNWNGGFATFLGFKWVGDRPAADRNRPSVIIVVPKKTEAIAETERAGGRGRMLFARETPFGGPRWCWTDVVQAVDFEGERAVTLPWSNPEDFDQLEADKTIRLRSGLPVRHSPGGSVQGSLGHLLKLKDGSLVGTTAAHVVGEGQPLIVGACPIDGELHRASKETRQHYFGGIFDHPSTSSFGGAEEFLLDGLVFRLPQETEFSSWQEERMATPPFVLRPDQGFQPLLETVVSVGATRGIQRGLVVGFGVRQERGGTPQISDYLIQPKGGYCEWEQTGKFFKFSDDGDSGKPVWLEKSAAPLGLLSGTLSDRNAIGVGPEFWSIVTDLNRLLTQAQVFPA